MAHRNALAAPSRREETSANRGHLFARLGLGGALLLALVCLALATGIGVHAQQSAGNQAPPTVVVAPVVSKAISQQAEFTGRVEAIQSVDIRARVEGYLEKVSFRDGATVKVGDLLYQIQQAPYQAALAQAEAQLAAAQAALTSAQARLNNQEINLKRQQTLVERDTVSQATLDDAQATRDTAAADVQSAQAQIQEAEAQVETAKINLNYTTISAAIDGRLGKTFVTVGNLITSASGTMALLNQLDPIRVAFSVPDRLYTNLVESMAAAGDANAVGTDLFTPSLQLPNGKPYQAPGKISFIGNEIDPNTGTITVYANFPNPNAVLLPGAFVVVTVNEAQEQTEPVIPAGAVLQDREGQYVFVLNSSDVVEQRRITIGRRTATDIAVQSGLEQGETIVVQGVQKIRPGIKVTPTTQSTLPAPGGGADASGSSASGSGNAAGSGSAAGTQGSAAAPPASSAAAPAQSEAASMNTGGAEISVESGGDAATAGNGAPAAPAPASSPGGTATDAGSGAAPATGPAPAASPPAATPTPPAPADSAPADPPNGQSAVPTDPAPSDAPATPNDSTSGASTSGASSSGGNAAPAGSASAVPQPLPNPLDAAREAGNPASAGSSPAQNGQN